MWSSLLSCRNSFQRWQNLPRTSEIVQVHIQLHFLKCVLFPSEVHWENFAKVLVNCCSTPLPTMMLRIQQYPHSSNTPWKRIQQGNRGEANQHEAESKLDLPTPTMKTPSATQYGWRWNFFRDSQEIPMFHPGADCYRGIDPILYQ